MSRKVAQESGFRQWPWRGIWTEIAAKLRDQGEQISASGVRKRYVRGNRTMIRLVDREVSRRARKASADGGGYAQ